MTQDADGHWYPSTASADQEGTLTTRDSRIMLDASVVDGARLMLLGNRRTVARFQTPASELLAFHRPTQSDPVTFVRATAAGYTDSRDRVLAKYEPARIVASFTRATVAGYAFDTVNPANFGVS